MHYVKSLIKINQDDISKMCLLKKQTHHIIFFSSLYLLLAGDSTMYHFLFWGTEVPKG
jgi:hypothetical protein